MPARRKTKAEHSLHNTRSKATINNAPTLPMDESVLTAPSYLSKVAQAEYTRVASDLHSAGLLPNVSLRVLATYAASYGNWLDAEQDIQKRGAVLFFETTTRTGKAVRPIANPSIRNYAVMKKLLLDAAKVLGIDPASRGRINLPEKPVEEDLDPFEAFLAGVPHPAFPDDDIRN